ncbi:MAG TPA: DUF6600 domain-containing protein [Blastocatellia bacterium]|nr:DUF6600 domain-containing protein [Blastocatellia bacterium]
MKLALLKTLTLCLLIALGVIPVETIAQTIERDREAYEQPEDDSPQPRAARLSYLQGNVSFLRAQVSDWADAVENLPLLTGDQIYAGAGARAEIQLGRGNYIRLLENTAITITDLSDSAAQFEITEGIAVIRAERVGSSFARFEVDTPNSALVLEQDGLYRVNVRGDDESEVIVRRGSAEVTTADGSFKVREGHRLVVDTSADGRLEIVADAGLDDWDRWSYERDAAIDQIASSPDYVESYETDHNSLYGVSELSSYGTWTSVASYGDCWVPRVSAGWAPYRAGQWLWIPAAGWTWVADEPWGWAPYHYGRWVFINGLGWAWAPGFRSHYSYNRSYYHWRPALVYFFNCPTSRGDYIGWYPLAPGQRWRRNYDGGRDRLSNPRVRGGSRRADDNTRAWRRPDRSDGITLQPIAGFQRPDQSRTRPEPAGRDIEQWINRGARPGLPEITPTNGAAAPTWRRGEDLRGARRTAVPPPDVINRPVVIRNKPLNPVVSSGAPRERRVLTPRRPDRFTEVAAPVRGAGRARTERRPTSDEQPRAVERKTDADPNPDRDKSERPGPSDQSGGGNRIREKNASRARFIPPVDGDHSASPKKSNERPREDRANEDRANQNRTREGRREERQQQRQREEQPRQERPREQRPSAAERPRSEEKQRPSAAEQPKPRHDEGSAPQRKKNKD